MSSACVSKRAHALNASKYYYSYASSVRFVYVYNLTIFNRDTVISSFEFVVAASMDIIPPSLRDAFNRSVFPSISLQKLNPFCLAHTYGDTKRNTNVETIQANEVGFNFNAIHPASRSNVENYMNQI